MECPICHMHFESRQGRLYELHLAAHRMLAAAVTYYDCPNACTVTGSRPPATCKHGKPQKDAHGR